VVPPSGVVHSQLFHTDEVVVYCLKGHSVVLCRSIARKMLDNSFYRFIRLCVKCKGVEIFLSEEFLCGVIVHHTFSRYPGFGCSVLEQELSTYDIF
jgi:hypothetical protein